MGETIGWMLMSISKYEGSNEYACTYIVSIETRKRAVPWIERHTKCWKTDHETTFNESLLDLMCYYLQSIELHHYVNYTPTNHPEH